MFNYMGFRVLRFLFITSLPVPKMSAAYLPKAQNTPRGILLTPLSGRIGNKEGLFAARRLKTPQNLKGGVKMKAQLQELFTGITKSQQKICRISEEGKAWRLSFVDNNIPDLSVKARRACEIEQEIKKHTEVIK